MSFLLHDSWVDAPTGSFVLVPGDVTHDFETAARPGPAFSTFPAPGDFEAHIPAVAEWFAEHPPGYAG